MTILARILPSICVVLMPVMSNAGGPRIGDPIDGQTESSDPHGRIRWSSRADAERNHKWEYEATVENYDQVGRCRVLWPMFPFESFIPPNTKVPALGPTRLLSAPSLESGPIVYNGGPAAGEDRKLTKAWLPEEKVASDATEKSIDASAQIYLVDGDDLHPVKIKAASTLTAGKEKKHRLTYNLMITSEARVVPELLQERVAVCWYSVWSEELLGRDGLRRRWDEGVEATAARFLILKDGRFEAEFETNDDVIVRQDSISFEVGPRQVEARAWLPAYAPKNSSRLIDPSSRAQRRPGRARARSNQ